MRIVVSLVLAAAMPAAALAIPVVSGDAWLCAIGQFESADGNSMVEIRNGSLALGTACPAKAAVAKRGRGRTVLRARWRRCAGMAGTVRVAVTQNAGSCDDVDVRVRAPKAHASRRFHARRSKGAAADCAAGDTFAEIERQIFGAKGCRVESCHGSAKAGGLDLRIGAAYGSLVGVAATGAPGALRVMPGDSARSFLVRKLAGVLARDEGDAMPSVGRPARALELDLVRAWIDAGAPETGTVADAPCPRPHVFEPAPPLAPPPDGYRIVYDGPVLQPGEEIEGCEWIETPNARDFVVGSWEYSLNPGTHHFALWEHRPEAAMPPLHTFTRDTACTGGGARFGLSISGAPEAPYFVDRYPGRVAKIVKGGGILGINPHYFNEFDVPIQIKVWINLHPAPADAVIADTLLSLGASLDGKSSFSILVPPFEVATLRLRYTNTQPRPITLPQITSHMHQRGVRFAAWRSDGSLLYENHGLVAPARAEPGAADHPRPRRPHRLPVHARQRRDASSPPLRRLGPRSRLRSGRARAAHVRRHRPGRDVFPHRARVLSVVLSRGAVRTATSRRRRASAARSTRPARAPSGCPLQHAERHGCVCPSMRNERERLRCTPPLARRVLLDE